MMPFRAVLRLVTLLTALTAAAAPVTRDLGDGLLYVRVRELPADLPAAAPVPGGGCVLDLRYLAAGRDAAAAFVVSPDGGAATFLGRGTVTDDFVDQLVARTREFLDARGGQQVELVAAREGLELVI